MEWTVPWMSRRTCAGGTGVRVTGGGGRWGGGSGCVVRGGAREVQHCVSVKGVRVCERV